jgi:hypothetical protein
MSHEAILIYLVHRHILRQWKSQAHGSPRFYSDNRTKARKSSFEALHHLKQN